MVSSPMYDRLMEFANSAPDNEKLCGWDDEHSAIVKAIREARDKPRAQSSASTSRPTST